MTASTRMKWGALPLAAAFVAGAAFAGDQEPLPRAASVGAGATAKVEAAATANVKVSASGFLLSLRLPVLAHETRDKGVPDEDVKLAVASLREAHVTPEDAIETFKATVASVEAKGPVEKFGELVQGKLKEGLRGNKLAKAIRDEHDKRGIGKGKKLHKRHGEHPGLHLGQRPEAKAAHMDEHGKPEGKAEKAADKAEKRSEKAGDKAEKAHGQDEKAEGHPGGKHGPGEAKAGKGKDK